GDDRSRGLIERIAGERHEDTSVRVHAITELGQLRSPAAEPALAEILDDDADEVRAAALAALERIFPAERTRTSMLALRSKHEDTSARTASFLARHGDPEVLVGRLAEIESAE